MSKDPTSLKKLEKEIGFTFSNKSLLTLALCHRSFGVDHNERLEFLGDSLVNMIIAEYIYDRFEEANEGQLSRLRASLVNGDSLARLAKDLNLGKYIALGRGEIKSNGCERPSILAGAMEALIGAVYLDAGFEQCQKCVLLWFKARFGALASIKKFKDPKTILQEYLQARKKPLPEYEVVDIEGKSHSQLFIVNCRTTELEEGIVGKGTSRRKAEQSAAEETLKRLGVL